ncbi:MAG: carbohydrate-binding domain-containing protein [Candidatus Symbiothrix sp.]|jgi:hypothetical protein|nr:carbohydrate-binding domain-containing protein [Candidatus Symbiothrix sp.]
MKYITLILCLLSSWVCLAQEQVKIYQGNSVLYQHTVSDISSIKFNNGSSVFTFSDHQTMSIPLTSIDSLLFATDVIYTGEAVYITYNDDNVTVVNPYENQGVTVTAFQTNVVVAATTDLDNILYVVSGSSTNGSLYLASAKDLRLQLNGISLTNPAGPAIQIYGDANATVELVANTVNALSDGANNTKNSCFKFGGALHLTGQGTLNVTSVVRHAIAADKAVTIDNGNLNLTISAATTLEPSGSGNETNHAAGLKSKDNITISGGELTITATSTATGGRGISADKDINITGGTINISTAGNGGTYTGTTGVTDSYSSACIKSDGMLSITGGVITCQSSGSGSKGLSADGNISITGGTINVKTTGAGAKYLVSGSTYDSYSSCCIKSNANISLLGGNITCSSSGSGGKAIKADGTMTIGVAGASNDNLYITASTSGARFQVSASSSGGGGGPGGGFGGGMGGSSTDYCNPDIIKSEGNMVINSGIIRANGTQTAEGGEGMETKAALTINGGDIQVTTYDDCINGGTSLTVNGGTIFVAARGQDAMDSNGSLTFNGGLVISNGVKGDGEAFDGQTGKYPINGGVLLGTCGSLMEYPSGPQKAVIFTAGAGKSICVKKGDEVILMFTVPVISGATSTTTGLKVVFSDPRLVAGTYTLQYNGAITGGTDFNGYKTGGTYSGGSTKTFTVSTSAYSSVTAQ